MVRPDRSDEPRIVVEEEGRKEEGSGERGKAAIMEWKKRALSVMVAR